MSRIEFLSWHGAGNQPPLIGVAQELVGRGHDVGFAGYVGQGASLVEFGFRFLPLPRADAAYATVVTRPGDVMSTLADTVWASPQHFADVADLLARQRPDVVVVDCLMFGALAALETADVPVVVLVHSAPGALCPPAGGLEQLVLDRLNWVRCGSGRRPVRRLWDAWAPFTTLCLSIPELDPLAGQVPPSFRFVGPVAPRVAPSGWQPPWPQRDPRPLVVASFSTGRAWDQTSRLRRSLDLAERYRVLALSGAADATGLTVPGDAVLRTHVPHAEVLPHAALALTHAGHGTVVACLAHGVPLVALPNPAADQPALAARVAELGAGIVLDGDHATTADIAGAVYSVLSDGSYRAAAHHVASLLRATDGATDAAEAIEQQELSPVGAARPPAARPREQRGRGSV